MLNEGSIQEPKEDLSPAGKDIRCTKRYELKGFLKRTKLKTRNNQA
jgi:hypothetical protein